MTIQPPPSPFPGPGEPPLPPAFEEGAPPPPGSKRVLAIILGVALVGGAIGGVLLVRSKDDPGTGSRALIPAGWTTHTNRSDGFRLGLPPGWKPVSSGTVDSALESMREQNEELARAIEQQVSGSLSDLVRFFAFDTRSPTFDEEFATNVNVVVEPLPAGVDFEAYLTANLRQLRGVPGVTVSDEQAVDLPGGPAALIKSRFTLNTPAGMREIAVTQYLMLKGNRGFILSETTTPKHEATYASMFEAIARTFQPF